MESFSHNKKNGGERVSKNKRQYTDDDEQKSFSNKALCLTSIALKSKASHENLELKTCAIGMDGCVPEEDWQCPNCNNIDKLFEDVMVSSVNCSLCSKIRKILISSDAKEEMSKSCSTNQERERARVKEEVEWRMWIERDEEGVRSGRRECDDVDFMLFSQRLVGKKNNIVEKVTWSGLELDALCVGVHRYGQENWDTILANTSLRVLKDETPQDLCMK
ncbi:uncharacterized protein G2W53_017456 [Senna tora]|uniref:Uncharacterized protein n=1 Tax=Senna tora TaxID=362788 RepID=A0A834TQU8_9FABA|nr:uncharacterized protein G2W53_017456 [Senna tora]